MSLDDRPMKIYFGRSGCNTNLTFLNQTVFEPFFEENSHNIIDIGRGCAHISCDHRMQWIYDKNYEQQIKNIKCRNGNKIIGNDIRRRNEEKLDEFGSTSTSMTPTFNANSLKQKTNYSKALNVDENE